MEGEDEIRDKRTERKDRNKERWQEILARTLRRNRSRDKLYAESSRGTDLAGAQSFALREIGAASQSSILFFPALPSPVHCQD